MLNYYKTDTAFLFEPVNKEGELRVEIRRPDGLIRVNGTPYYMYVCVIILSSIKNQQASKTRTHQAPSTP